MAARADLVRLRVSDQHLDIRVVWPDDFRWFWVGVCIFSAYISLVVCGSCLEGMSFQALQGRGFFLEIFFLDLLKFAQLNT